MPGSITLHALSYTTPDNHPLFDALDLSFGPVHTGLVGRNGTGKSTLLKLIAGELTPLSGAISMTGTLGILRQSVQLDPTQTIATLFGITEALATHARLENGTSTLDDAANADWSLPARLDAAFAQTGLDNLDPHRLLATLSGGQRTRLALSALIFQQPDMLLLDEPTSNLDADGRAAVAHLLSNWRGGAIVVSHDRTLLNQMDAIVELTALGATSYGGNYDYYTGQKAAALAAAQQTLDAAEQKLTALNRKLQTVAERKSRKDAAGAKQRARNDMPKILLNARRANAQNSAGENVRLATMLRTAATDQAANARAAIEIAQPLSVTLAPTGLPSGRLVLDAQNLTGGPDTDYPIIENLSLSITGPERIAITGPNGSGKTTFLHLITGQLSPRSGSAQIHVPFAMLDQNVSLLAPSDSILDNFRRLNPGTDENACRAALARFMFRADAALQIVGMLSGGQTLRAGLAATIGGDHPPQLLVLDEPTNHLDLDTIAELEAGLRAYDGALIVVSHDRAFLDAIAITREITL